MKTIMILVTFLGVSGAAVHAGANNVGVRASAAQAENDYVKLPGSNGDAGFCYDQDRTVETFILTPHTQCTTGDLKLKDAVNKCINAKRQWLKAI